MLGGAIEHVLAVSARIAGKLDFVSASVGRRTRRRCIIVVGHGMFSAEWPSGSARKQYVSRSRSQSQSQPEREEAAAVWRRSPRGVESATTARPSDPPPAPSAAAVCAPPTLRAPLTLRICLLPTGHCSAADLGWHSTFTDDGAGGVADAMSPCPQNDDPPRDFMVDRAQGGLVSSKEMGVPAALSS